MLWSYFLAHSLFTRLPAASGPPNPAPKTLCSSPAKEAKERASLSFPFECVWMKPKQQGPTSSWVTSMPWQHSHHGFQHTSGCWMAGLVGWLWKPPSKKKKKTSTLLLLQLVVGWLSAPQWREPGRRRNAQLPRRPQQSLPCATAVAP